MTLITAIRTPRSTASAQALLERFAELDGQIAAIEEDRKASIAWVNQRCDTAVADLSAERDAIRARLEPWWRSAGAALAKGARKSIELGGCMIGLRKGRDRLAVAGDEDQVLTYLKTFRWARDLIRVKYSLDRAAVLKALRGKYAPVLAELGLSCDAGEDAFFVERVAQDGVVAGAAA